MVGLERRLGRLGRRVRRRLRPLRRVPGEVWLGGIGLAIVLLGVFGAIVPLLTTGGRDPRAEVSGRYPSSIALGQPFDLAVAVDNTSAALIQPLCLVEHSIPEGRVTAGRAVFQGLDSVPFVHGRACGGQLSGQLVISVRVLLQAQQAGTARISLQAAEGDRIIGPELAGTVQIVQP